MEKEKIQIVKDVYAWMKGALSQAPNSGGAQSIYDASTWVDFNAEVDSLNTIEEGDFTKYKIIPERNENGTWVSINTYRRKLSSLIGVLHSRYFQSEPEPFSGRPTTIISQNQTQQQTQIVTIVLEIQDIINKKLYEGKGELKEEEKSYLETVKASLSGIKNISELVNLILSTAESLGLTTEQISKLFNIS